MIFTGWDNLRDAVTLELEQRAYEGALVPEGLREQVAALVPGDDDMNLEKIEPLFDALAALGLDPDYPYLQPNDLAGIRRERPDGPRRLSVDLSSDELLDRFHGAWTGRASGCALGKPVEGLGIFGADGLDGRATIRAYLEHRGHWPLDFYFSGVDAGDGLVLSCPESQRERIAYMEPDDDIHYTLIALHILETVGAGFSWYDVADAWNQCLPYGAICTAETQAILNYNVANPKFALYRGEASRPDPAWTSTHSNPYREWIGAQIRADGWGYACAGNPELAAELAWRDASWTHTANGIYGEMFFAAMIAASFVETDPTRLVEIGLSEIPRNCRLAEAVTTALDWFGACPSADDFMDKVDAGYGDLHGVHTVNNALIAVMAPFYGAMDTHDSITTAVAAGLDTDCNGATVGSIVGAAAGHEEFDARLAEPLNDTVKPLVFGFQEITLRELAERQLRVYEDIKRYAAQQT
jgi:ADP-ribosylglycohydrolase